MSQVHKTTSTNGNSFVTLHASNANSNEPKNYLRHKQSESGHIHDKIDLDAKPTIPITIEGVFQLIQLIFSNPDNNFKQIAEKYRQSPNCFTWAMVYFLSALLGVVLSIGVFGGVINQYRLIVEYCTNMTLHSDIQTCAPAGLSCIDDGYGIDVNSQKIQPLHLRSFDNSELGYNITVTPTNMLNRAYPDRILYESIQFKVKVELCVPALQIFDTRHGFVFPICFEVFETTYQSKIQLAEHKDNKQTTKCEKCLNNRGGCGLEGHVCPFLFTPHLPANSTLDIMGCICKYQWEHTYVPMPFKENTAHPTKTTNTAQSSHV